MSNILRKDAIVIGGGPGGYVAAIRLGQLKKTVALIEKDQVGGVCLNWGCIPSKALIHAAKMYEDMLHHAQEVGITAKGVSIDLSKTQAWKKSVVKKLTGGIEQLAKAAGVEIVRGEARFETPHSVTVKKSDGTSQIVEFKDAIVATGSTPIAIPGFSFDGKLVVDSKEALDWTSAPKSLAIIGGGVIGLEIGMLYQKFGSQVSIVEMTDQLLPGMDPEIAQLIQRTCKKRGIEVFLQSKATGHAPQKKGGTSLEIETPQGKRSIDADAILLAVGRRPDPTVVGLEKIGFPNKGAIAVNRRMQSNLHPHLYVIGDLAGPPLLAHKASKEGVVAAECIAGLASENDYRAMPGAVFTDPEVATVGLTQAEAEKRGMDVHVGKFPFVASGRALSTNHADGFVKIVVEKGTELVVGAHMVGDHVSELIGEVTLAIEMGATVEDLALTIHPHPTLSEAVMEASEAALGKAIHTVNR